jgi:hypothetical protein
MGLKAPNFSGHGDVRNLKTTGNTATISTTNTVIKDKLLELGNGETGTPSGDAGIVIERGSSANAFIGWDESADKIVLGTTSATGASSGDLTITPTDLNVSDIALTPDGITTSHITTTGSLKIRATANMHIGDDGVDSIRLGRVNSTAAKIHLRSGADDDLVISGNKVGIGTDSPATTLHVDGVVSVGANDAGHDVVFYGDTASANVTWDASVDDLIVNGAARVVVPDGQLVLGSTAISSTAAELNILDGKAFLDEDNMASNSATGIASQQSIKAYVDSQTSGAGNMDNWILEDDDGTEVTVSNGKEVKFIGSGLTTNFTDTDNGTDADPYDLTFTVDAAQTGITSVLNTSLVAGRDADNQIKFSTDNQIIFRVSGGDGVTMKASGEIEATSLDISGDADIDGTLEADAITVDGTALAEYISDTVGAMVGGNTETGITVSYDDADNTLDFVLAAVGTNAISDDAVTLDKMAGLARGKIIYGDASGNPAALAAGSNNQVLTSDGTDISWQNASGGGTAVDDLNLILHTQVFS